MKSPIRKLLVLTNQSSSGSLIYFPYRCFDNERSKYAKIYICNTVEPLYSGHHLELEKVSAIERCPLHRGLSKIDLFCLENSP